MSESDFSEESYIDPFSGDLAAYTDASGTDINGDGSLMKDLAGGGELVLGFGVMDVLDTCVDSVRISNINVYDPPNAMNFQKANRKKL